MSLPNDVRTEGILLEDDERDSIEYKILMAYARRRLPASKYWKLLKNEANVQKSSSLAGRGVTSNHQRDKDEPLYRFPTRRAGGQIFSSTSTHRIHACEPADVGHIADKLAKLVTVAPRSWQFPVAEYQGAPLQEDKGESTAGSEAKKHNEVLIRSIVSLLRQKGDQLEEEMKRNGGFYQCFQDTLSYNFFKKITDRFLRVVPANSPGVTAGQAQRLRIAYTMEVATRLNAVDNHPMNLVLGFGSKYLREHFKPWIQDQGGWEKAVISLDEEEVE
ncbi:apoptosis facilitator Bcl-2-like protein 14 [Dryobates pubescens]|uniref:apoptosis facilitator Bcl-2-like protein 14 n=1 Tax=Dryobates pubescens TaxID=118200 RepID=UPI0023B9BB41|nr:apoptosis facilitator Bcl-2-like protein 14 [Dryobates pubescens]